MATSDYRIREAKNFGWHLNELNQLCRRDGSVYMTKQRPTEDNPYHKIRITIDGVRKSISRARLVCSLAKGDPPTEDHVVHHKNHQTYDDRPENLEWVTISENNNFVSEEVMEMRKRNLAKGREERAKLSKEDVISIRRLKIHGGLTYRQLSKMYNVTKRHLIDVVNFKSWTEINDPLYPTLKSLKKAA